MVFNSDSYFANKHRRAAFDHLAEARRVKAGGESGMADLLGFANWRARVAFLVQCARTDMNLCRIYRRAVAEDRAARGKPPLKPPKTTARKLT
jgi:hypothetical protein